MKLKKADVLALYHELNSPKYESLKGEYVRFSYCIMKNLRILKNEVQPIFDLTEEYNRDRNKVLSDFAKKDEKDQYILSEQGGFTYNKEDRERIEKALQEVENKHKKVIEDIPEILQEEIELDLYKISIDRIEGIDFMNKSILSIIDPILD